MVVDLSVLRRAQLLFEYGKHLAEHHAFGKYVVRTQGA
jgi:hypothetical protein